MSEVETKLYTAAQVRSLDACAIHDHGIDGYELMSRAGQTIYDAIELRFPDVSRYTILCGAGNNAGDGYVVARLAGNAEKIVEVYSLVPPDKLKGDALIASQDWLDAGGKINDWPDNGPFHQTGVVIDALLGTGLDRAVDGIFKEAIEWINAQSGPVVSVDIPSGLNADTGQAMQVACRADLTVTFIGMKQGLFTGDAADCVGELIFESLEVPPSVYQTVANKGNIIRENLLLKLLHKRSRRSHKGTFGHVLIAGGYQSMSGAVRLAGEAALRSGSGKVSIVTHSEHAGFINLGRPELMVAGFSESMEHHGRTGSMFERADVIVAGPGMGTNAWSHALFKSCIDGDKPLVVDADGLNILAESPQRCGNWILTPHSGEAGRLLGVSTAEIEANRIDSACLLAHKYKACVVLKGCGTVIAKSDGEFAICPLGNPGMATAGSGDVLSGIIASFRGQGLSAWDAARAGVVAHAAAGDHTVKSIGEFSLLAGDIINGLAPVLKRFNDE